MTSVALTVNTDGYLDSEDLLCFFHHVPSVGRVPRDQQREFPAAALSFSVRGLNIACLFCIP